MGRIKIKIRNRGNNTPMAIFGGITKIRIGMLIAPSAPPKPDFEIETANTDRIHISAK